MDPDEQSDLDLHCLSKRLQTFQQTTKEYDFFVICALRVDKCEQCIYGRDFYGMRDCLRGSNNFLTVNQIDRT